MYPSKGSRVPGPVNVRAERLDQLAGERGDVRAVTTDDAAAMGLTALKSALVTAAPTAAQHNALVEDVRMLAAMLNRIGATITGL